MSNHRHFCWRKLALIFLALVATNSSASEFVEQEISFKSGIVNLAGTVILPSHPGPHPGVVFLHGSGQVTRTGARPYAEEFAHLGFASLFFDKRGTGESGGSWISSSLEDLADDANAAVLALGAIPMVDAAQIGFWGVSQAAWVAPLAASKSDNISFMVLISGGGASPRESELFSYARSFDRAGLGQADQKTAFAVIQEYFDYLSTGVGRENLLMRLEASQDSAWQPYADLKRILPSETNRSNWSWVADWSPIPSIATFKGPILLMFGDLDNDQPTGRAIEQWKTGLAMAGNEQGTIMVFPGAGHGIRMSAVHYGSHGNQPRAPFADGYKDAMVGWLWRNVVSPSN